MLHRVIKNRADERPEEIGGDNVSEFYEPKHLRPEEKEPPRRAPLSLRRKRRRLLVRLVLASCALLVVIGIGMAVASVLSGLPQVQNLPLGGPQDLDEIDIPDWIDQEFLDFGGSRSGEKLEHVNDIAIHYVGNPGTSAMGNRSYFNDPATEVNAHFLVGLDGEIIQCLPLDEKSAATNERNRDTISIEVCHPDETGQFTDDSYRSLVKLCAWLCRDLGLDENHLIRHYDVTGKACPLYFVEHPDAWESFRADVGEALRNLA